MTSLSRDVEPFREVFRRAFERAISKVLRHEGACVCILAGLRLCMPCCPAYGPWGASMDNGASACSRLVLVSEKTLTPLHRAVTAFSNLFSVYASVSDTHSRCCPGRSGVPTQVTCARANTYTVAKSGCSLSRSLALSLSHSLAFSLSRSLALSLSRSLALSLS